MCIRDSDSSTAADVRYLLVLVLQTCVLSGITFLNYFHDTCQMCIRDRLNAIVGFSQLLSNPDLPLEDEEKLEFSSLVQHLSLIHISKSSTSLIRL